MEHEVEIAKHARGPRTGLGQRLPITAAKTDAGEPPQALAEAIRDRRRREGTPATFLFSLLSAAWGRQSKFEADYTYLAKDYRIQIEKQPDQPAGRRFAEAGLTRSPDSVVLLKGTILEIAKNKSFQFRLWSEGTSRPELPIRFEYRARPFLRLAFERDPSQAPAHPGNPS